MSEGEALNRYQYEDSARKCDLEYAIKSINVLKDKFQFDSIAAHYFIGESCSKNGLDSAYTMLDCRDSDIVIFYYSGHGHSHTDTLNRLPVMSMSSHNSPIKMIRKNSVPVTSIIDWLKKKGAYLNFIIADCCNTEIENDWSGIASTDWNPEVTTKTFHQKKDTCHIIDTCPKRHCLVITLCAAEKGYSTSVEINSLVKNSSLGSWFTRSLTSNFDNHLARERSNSSSKYSTKFSLNSLMNSVKADLDDYVQGYNFVQRRQGRKEIQKSYSPFYQITFW